jgi:adenylate cyclase
MASLPIDAPATSAAPFLAERPGWRSLLVISGLMFLAQAIGSVFNIVYNLLHIPPLLTEAQEAAFKSSIAVYNAIAYPLLLALWVWAVCRLRRPARDEAALEALRRRAVNLPVVAAAIAAAGWFLSIPALYLGLVLSGEAVNPHVWFHFPVSVCIAAVVALTIGYFSIDWARQRLLFPCLFRDESPAKLEGTFRLSVSGRGKLWTLAASICPIFSLLLLLIDPTPSDGDVWFALAVAGSGILCAVVSSVLMARLVVTPVEELRRAAERIGRGELDARMDHLRADEFGILADAFNGMVEGLREKERIAGTFGRHVGREIAEQLLHHEEELGGVERVLSVLFADLRGFTTRCEKLAASDAVKLLNLYHEHMTGVIEEHGGIVNQLVGDGIMALFGATGRSERHAAEAVAAGRAMLLGLDELNAKLAGHGFEPVRIGVGIHTGPAVVGTIGSPRRMEYTAIGDTVNTAARIEGLTKEMGRPLLISASTYESADPRPAAARLDPVPIRGRSGEMTLYSVEL